MTVVFGMLVTHWLSMRFSTPEAKAVRHTSSPNNSYIAASGTRSPHSRRPTRDFETTYVDVADCVESKPAPISHAIYNPNDRAHHFTLR
jgi:hypothetical protein